ncbi:hypothetical protein TorRG33x02_038550 [Trema orientale]|uniref:F-box protein At3g26010-like beta-propeller domain-containing protein n=1 Tax=Trema orientale TaxID=63057 RepID=A0A2P5FRQ6_TREOI|nr:hypothetical protein TorRG33x02_038550 [Trema orientale]
MGEDNDPHYLEPFCQVISEKVHHGKVPSDFLSFLPCPVAILASFDDLVVATSTEYGPLHGATDNYICNPLTKQWLALPKVIPPVNNAGYAFVREPTSCNKQLGFTSNARYRFVMIGHAHSDSRFELGVGGRHFCMENEFVTKVFCSEIGQWREYVITFPQHQAVIPTPIWGASRNPDLRIVTNNGILYWLEGLPLRGIVAFDPFSDIYTNHCRFIRLPVVFFNKTVHATDGKVCLGVVKGQLRLSQFYHAKAQPYFVFKVWELRNHDSESPVWALVYNLKLNTSERNVYMLSFHPNNTNVVFLLYGNDICRYIISEKKYEKVGDYPLKVDNPCADISTYTIVYPPWPTPMFTLPSKGVNEDSSAEKGLAHNKEDVDDLLL